MSVIILPLAAGMLGLRGLNDDQISIPKDVWESMCSSPSSCGESIAVWQPDRQIHLDVGFPLSQACGGCPS